MSNLIQKLSGELEGKSFKFSDIDVFGDVDNWISTGSPYLDYCLKTHGYPTGIVEVRGASQSGKTTFSLEAMKSCISQYKDKAVVVILSSERRDNRALAKMIGVPLDDVLIIPTRTIEEVFNQLSRTVDKVKELNGDSLEGIRFFFVWDSLGNTVSKAEADALQIRKDNKKKDDDTKSAAMASAARAISLGLRGVVSLTDEIDSTFFIINRAYNKIGGVGKTSYGGTAVEFYPNMRIELARKEGVKVGDDEVGQITLVKTIKTDFDRPKQQFECEIGYGYGLVLCQGDIDLGIELGLLEKFGQNGAKFNEKLKWKSRRELYRHYEEKNPMLNVFVKKLTKALHKMTVEEHQARME